ncbi:hypothetical protein N9937_01245 [bacterium]|nr:hypothetical protein [bacterium]
MRLARANRRDDGEKAIVEGLRAAGCSVIQIDAGDGFPDLVVGRAGKTYLLECKEKPGKGVDKRRTQLNPLQQQWFSLFNGHAEVVRSIDEALTAIGLSGE